MRDFVLRIRMDERYKDCAIALMVERNNHELVARSLLTDMHKFTDVMAREHNIHNTDIWCIRHVRGSRTFEGADTDNAVKDLGQHLLFQALNQETVHIADRPVGNNVEEALRLMESELKAMQITIGRSGRREIKGKNAGPDDLGISLMLGIGFRPEFTTYPQYHTLVDRNGYSDNWTVDHPLA